MDAQLPPPPAREPGPSERSLTRWQDVVPAGPVATKRPGIVTSAAWILIVVGGLGILGGLVLLTNAGGRIATLPAEGTRAAGTIAVVLAAFEILAGVLVLRLRPAGRVTGIVFAALGLLSALVRLSTSPVAGLIALALDGFVIYALASSGPHFRDRTRR